MLPAKRAAQHCHFTVDNASPTTPRAVAAAVAAAVAQTRRRVQPHNHGVRQLQLLLLNLNLHVVGRKAVRTLFDFFGTGDYHGIVQVN